MVQPLLKDGQGVGRSIDPRKDGRDQGCAIADGPSLDDTYLFPETAAAARERFLRQGLRRRAGCRTGHPGPVGAASGFESERARGADCGGSRAEGLEHRRCRLRPSPAPLGFSSGVAPAPRPSPSGAPLLRHRGLRGSQGRWVSPPLTQRRGVARGGLSGAATGLITQQRAGRARQEPLGTAERPPHRGLNPCSGLRLTLRQLRVPWRGRTSVL